MLPPIIIAARVVFVEIAWLNHRPSDSDVLGLLKVRRITSKAILLLLQGH
ncbi:MAG: hypothetical protein ACI9NY_001923 [Kiritimatiellia bacterium]|jgi:hypothetical protein